MIRPYQLQDARRLKANEHSDIADMGWVLNDDGFMKHTMECDGRVLCIICFKAYWQNNYMAFLLISKEMTAVHGRALKRWIFNAMMDLRMQRVQTDSVDCPVINRWHKFLGFTLEGTRMKMVFDKDYKMWAFVKGRDF